MQQAFIQQNNMLSTFLAGPELDFTTVTRVIRIARKKNVNMIESNDYGDIVVIRIDRKNL